MSAEWQPSSWRTRPIAQVLHHILRLKSALLILIAVALSGCEVS